ncbi:uncharacterized protein HD556DRAFT_1280298 [Suillus plorans]|uniref:Uncharacterized protein n=1 Tax=Suillus plorans TaxID=116603 RepID=A0A9P7A8V5_9AGAM|nr:uncharacterized protein HD556DRAFT_1280298 [Suillus plorans]KAG1784624.1 hypothetical protein HD556DRAFT_1280298 [Suillus plorans]
MDTSTCVQEDICDFDMYYASHSPPPQSPSESVAQSPLIPPSQVKRIRKPARVRAAGFDDPLPEGPGPLEADGSGCVEPEVVAPPEPIENVDPQTPAFCLRHFLIRIPEIVRTLPNAFGLTRLYRGRPTRIPDLDSDLNDLTATNLQTLPAITDKSISDIISPYPNENAFNFGRWYWNTTRQSKSTRQELLDNVILHPGFDPEDLRGVNFDKIDKQLAQDLSSPLEGNGWRNDPITVNIPTSQKAGTVGTRKFCIGDFHHRSLVHILRTAIESNTPHAQQYHWHPYEQFHQSPDPNTPPVRVFDEVYTGDAFLKADRDLQNSPGEPDCDLPRVIAGIMVWSDATHVAQFGQARLWPIYIYLANLSKYSRCKPTSTASHQAAYLPKVGRFSRVAYILVSTLPRSFLILCRIFYGHLTMAH